VRTQQKAMDTVPSATGFGPADTFVAVIQAHEKLAADTARFPHRSRSGATDDKAAYLWLEAGQSFPYLRGTEMISNRALRGWLIVVAACVGWAAIMMATGGMRPADTTAQMELLAQKLNRRTAIPADTANELARLIARPGYDCDHVACSAELAVRNEAARTRLKQLLASKVPANALDVSASRALPVAAAENTH
jgi:hypothetical protein